MAKRLDQLSQSALEDRLRSLRSRRAKAPTEDQGTRRHLKRAEARVLVEFNRRRNLRGDNKRRNA